MNLVSKYVNINPWDREPDNETYTDRNYLCIINRRPFGTLDGYIGVMLYDEYQIENAIGGLKVHGGLNYIGEGKGILPKENPLRQSLYWIGISCNQENDIIPVFPNKILGRTYKNIDFVKKELKKIVDQFEGE